MTHEELVHQIRQKKSFLTGLRLTQLYAKTDKRAYTSAAAHPRLRIRKRAEWIVQEGSKFLGDLPYLPLNPLAKYFRNLSTHKKLRASRPLRMRIRGTGASAPVYGLIRGGRRKGMEFQKPYLYELQEVVGAY